VEQSDTISAAKRAYLNASNFERLERFELLL
jgi:hypothetical protein